MFRPIAALLAVLISSAPSIAPPPASAAPPATPVPVPTRAAVVRRVMRSSVRVQVFAGGELSRSATGVVVHGGLGTAVAHEAFILTNAHVADPAGLKDVSYRVLLERHGRVVRTLPARLIAVGHVPELDLALLAVEADLPAIDLAPEPSIDLGEDVVVVGAPYGYALSVSGGIVSQLEAADGPDLRYTGMKTDAAIGYGCSGGGVFGVPGGRLLGVVEGYRTARVAIDDHTAFDVPMPGETFVAPVTKIRDFLAAHLTPAALTALRGPEPAAGPAPMKPAP